ncbi:putative pumilio, chloroplastic [Cocos nucifera]|nr:putative pumilio, chloroplastic [Cocos nucifera]
MIFNVIIDHVVALMVNLFGNYLMQNLLEAYTEEQRMKILLVLTEDPAELIRISWNTHGFCSFAHIILYLLVIRYPSLIMQSSTLICSNWCLVRLCCSRTRSVQKLIETLKNPQQIAPVISALTQGF